MKNLLGNKKGTSLVEILVVMIVLLIGIMTIIQMFPTGFRVVRSAENQSIATRLAEQELVRWKNMAANLPTGILAIYANGDTNDGNIPLPPFEGVTGVDGSGHPIFGNGLNARYVIGETTTIPIASFFETGEGAIYGSKYTLAFSPIDRSAGVVVKSGDMKRIDADANYYPPVIRPGQYAIDYSIVDGTNNTPSGDNSGEKVFRVAFPTDAGTANRTYYITYSYWSDDSKTYAQIDEPVEVPGDYRGWVEVPIVEVTGHVIADNSIVSDSDTCARGFVNIGNDDFGDNPYEFKIADSIMGVIAFNPSGNGVFEYTANGIKPLQARIDYHIYDLRIIHEDRVVPQPAYNDAPNIPIKLSLKYILAIGDNTDNPGEDSYKGLINDSSITVPLPLYVVDLATGLRVNVPTNEYDDSTTTTQAQGGIDYKQGIVYLPIRANFLNFNSDVVDGNQPLAGRHLRFLYRADGDWSVQCHKAYANYARADEPGGVDHRHFAIHPDVANELLFAPCDAAKTVSIDYTYFFDGAEHKVTADSFQISDTTFSIGTNKYCYVDLNHSTHFPSGAELRRIVVTGTSFMVRVLWRDGKNWRHVDMDTSLIRDAD